MTVKSDNGSQAGRDNEWKDRKKEYNILQLLLVEKSSTSKYLLQNSVTIQFDVNIYHYYYFPFMFKETL